ncbi:MAG: hypothetical protein KIS92_17045 [Planctomycetota bacterium]|nr:hypothetical protein [Planctomycetota bacterium]
MNAPAAVLPFDGSAIPARPRRARAWGLGVGMLGWLGAACLLAGCAPLALNIAIVFLFAGPHNWMEFRYMLARMPAAWGRLRGFYALALGGTVVLAGAMIGLPYLARHRGWDYADWQFGAALWNVALLGWLAALAWQVWTRPLQRTALAASAAVLAMAAWQYPGAWALGLVYAHPLVALAFFAREIKRRRPEALRAYLAALALVPVALAFLWWRLGDAPDLRGADILSMRIALQSGAGLLPKVSSSFLVASHAFLELLHYGVWILAVPLLTLKASPLDVEAVPLAKKSRTWRWALSGSLLCGLLLVVGLWGGFLADYAVTRDLYFSIAIVHVLGEFPFLMRG